MKILYNEGYKENSTKMLVENTITVEIQSKLKITAISATKTK